MSLQKITSDRDAENKWACGIPPQLNSLLYNSCTYSLGSKVEDCKLEEWYTCSEISSLEMTEQLHSLKSHKYGCLNRTWTWAIPTNIITWNIGFFCGLNPRPTYNEGMVRAGERSPPIGYHCFTAEVAFGNVWDHFWFLSRKISPGI